MFRSRSKRSNASQLSGGQRSTGRPHSQAQAQAQAYQATYHLPPELIQDDLETDEPDLFPPLSEDSSNAVPDSIWFCHDFILGAGAVIIQPATQLMVLIYQSSTRSWFLPKGRKDTGESLEETALREAYEESGYRAKFLPLALPSLAPLPPKTRNDLANLANPAGPSQSHSHSHTRTRTRTRSRSQSRAASSASASSASRPPLELNTEPIYMTTQCLTRRRNGTLYQYVTYWYVAFIEEDAEREEDTGMPDEKDYESYLVTYEEAMKRLRGVQRVIADRGYRWWRNTDKWVEEELVESVARLGPASPTRQEGGYEYADETRGEDRGPYQE